MKLKNFAPRPMREVEYYGVNISIPADHEWVATDAAGGISSCSDELVYADTGYWYAGNLGASYLCLGVVDPISAEDAANSLRHYPVGDNK